MSKGLNLSGWRFPVVEKRYSLDGAALELGCSVAQVCRLIGGPKGSESSGPLDSYRVGRRRYVTQTQLDAYRLRVAQ